MADEPKENEQEQEEKPEAQEEALKPEDVVEGGDKPEGDEKGGEEEKKPDLTPQEQRRQDIESQLDLPPAPPEGEEETEGGEEAKPEEEKKPEGEKEGEEKDEDESVIDRIKSKVQKRIDKVVGEKKTLEEQNADLKAENERLKKGEKAEGEEKPDKPKEEEKPEAESGEEPTDEDIELALQDARNKGDIKFERQIIKFMIEREGKKIAAQTVASENEKVEKQQRLNTEVNRDLNEVVRDYTITDDDGKEQTDHPLNLNNKQGLLFKTAVAFFNDPTLRDTVYKPSKDGNWVPAFRRAVADAFKELSVRGVKPSTVVKKPKTQDNERSSADAKKRRKKSLAEGGTEGADKSTPSRPLTDTEKVGDEVTRRRKELSSKTLATA